MRILNQRMRRTLALAAAAFLVTLPASSQDGTLATGPDMDEVITDFTLSGTPLEGVLDTLAMLTGRAILRPQALPTPEITFDPGGPITRGELIRAIESLLSLNGIGVSPLGERFLKVVPLNAISREAPELVTESLEGREPSGKVVSKLFRLEYLDSQTFQQQIQPFLSGGFSSIIPFQNSNAVIVTDTVSNLKRLEYVVSQVDKPSRLNIETVFYTLQYADASEVAQQIQRMIDDARNRFGQQGQQGRQGARPQQATQEAPPVPIGQPGSESAVSLQVLFGSNTAISSDDRTNQLIIMTEPGNLQFFENIIEKFDVRADPSTRIEVIPLKHADAAEVASLLSQFVSGRTGSDTSDRRGAARTRESRRNRTMPGSPTFGDASQDLAPAVTREAVVNAATASLEDRESQFSPFMTILADERSNALVISGTRGDLELMTSLVDRIDVLLPQVRIEVIIAEVSLDDSVTRGMDAFSVNYEELADGSADVTFPARRSGTGETVQEGINFLGLGLGGTFNYADGVVTNLTLDAIFNTARTNNNVSLLSVPTLVTTHNKEATIVVAEGRPIVTSAMTTTISDSFRQSVQYQDIGIELVVTPLIGPNNIIQLEIDQKIDDVTGNVTIGNNPQPIIGRRQATSYVSVADGELIVLGGLQRSNSREEESKMAILGEIPLLGNLFTRRHRSNTKTELLVFIRPKVMRSTGEADENARETLRNIAPTRSIEQYLRSGELDASLRESGDGDPRGRQDEEAESGKNRPKGFRKR